ncbi:response regulator [Pseudodesulfovibrio senegalensis]|uniref:Sensory/regulatory protein RpfC n=1 Tax=Pseudodesulfovibrio senegalensis TaxID=1721087 RepID=A0A6N6N5R4_9BACT|nr:response regulator [Pseudodesulfovibrio senegalensis]
MRVAQAENGVEPVNRKSRQSDNSRGHGETLVPLLLLGAGLLLGLLFHSVARQWERGGTVHALQAESELVRHDVMQAYRRIRIIGAAMHGFMNQDRAVSSSDFVSFVRPLHLFADGVLAMEWVPRVTGDERAEFERAMREQGNPEFTIRELQPDDTLIPAKDRREYFPVSYVYPQRENRVVSGLDLATSPERRQALLQASMTGLPSLSKPIRLVQDTGVGRGLVFFSPVFEELEAGIGVAGFERLKGVVLIVLRTDAFFGSALSASERPDLGVLFHDVSPSGQERFLFGHRVSQAGYANLPEGGYSQFDLEVGQRLWRVTCVPLPGFVERLDTLLPVGGAMGIFMVASLAALFLYMSSLHGNKARERQNRETQELQRTALQLDCLYAVFNLTDRPGADVMTVLRRAAVIVRPVFAGFEGVSVTIHHDGHVFGDRPPEGAEPLLEETIHGPEAIGRICIYCSEENDESVGREQERSFLQSIAAHLGAFVERRRGEQVLVAARDQARKAAQAKSEFLANMSHEIRTPLNAILGLGELVGRTGLSPRQMDYFNKITGASQSLLGIVNDILDFSRIEAGKLEFDRQPFELSSVLLKILDIYSPRASAKGVRFNVVVEPGVPARLVGDALRLEQVFANLVTNAVKFTETGVIEMGVAPVAVGSEHVRIRAWVMDTGIGIRLEEQPGLFEAFTQADGSYTRRHGGTGLGLAISRQLVNLMDGDIELTSDPGRGSTFAFEAQFDAAEPEPGLDLCAEFAGKTALVTLRDPEQDRAAHALEELGFRVERLDTAGRAWRRLRDPGQDAVDLIWLGWGLPDENGLELARRIRRSDEPFNSVPLVLCTGNFNEELRRIARQIADAVILRPVSGRGVFDAVARLFEVEDSIAGPRMQKPGAEHDVLIIVVEDNSVNRQVLQEILEGIGVRVHVAEHGRQAVDMVLLGDDVYDAVIMDVQMPIMDGLSATRAIRERFSAAELPIVALTAHAMVEDRQKCLDAGMNDYVTKPLNVDILLTTLGRWVHGPAWVLPARTESPEPENVPADLRDLPGLDVLDGLKRLGGNADVYKRLLLEFLNDHADVGDRVHKALDRNDISEVLKLVHTIKGVAGNMSALELHDAAMELEDALKLGELYDRPLADFESRLKRVMEPLKRLAEGEADNGPHAQCSGGAVVDEDHLLDFRQLVENHDFRIVQVFETLKKNLECQMENEDFQRLAKAVSSFDFENVAELLGSVDIKNRVNTTE